MTQPVHALNGHLAVTLQGSCLLCVLSIDDAMGLGGCSSFSPILFPQSDPSRPFFSVRSN